MLTNTGSGAILSELRLRDLTEIIKLKKEMKKVLDNSRLDVIAYQSYCKRETKTTSKKLKKLLDKQKTT